ncbi:Enolase [Hirschfeldia incana]|nr:Enolase [Hirschfeldia incana]
MSSTRRRTDLRGFLKQSQKKTSERSSSSSYLVNNSGSRCRKECCDEEEVVKYMSKLPAYLQGGGEVECSNVLNVGVLDWSRLENWKQHGSDKCERRVSSTTLGTLPIDDDHHQVHASSDLGKKVKASRRDLLQHGVGCTLEPELELDSSLNTQERPACSYNSSAKDQERAKNPDKSRRSPSLSTIGNSGGSLGSKGRSFMVRDKETDKRTREILHAQEAKERRKQCVDKLDGASDTILTCEKHQEEVSNIVLLRSRKQSPTTLLLSSDMPSSLDDNNAQVAREVIRSLHLERDSEDMMLLPLLHGVHLSPKKESSGTRTTKHSKTASSRRIFDQEKKRDPSSPSKRFSFSFGRLSRSFTFKEEEDSSASDSMRLEGLALPSQSSNQEEKQNTHCGSRVSPLRRLLLNPLLKPKDHPENLLLPSKSRSSSFNQDEKQKQDASSRTRALLQLTIRNGIPMFQFVVDDDNLNKSKSRSILGATMKSSSDASSLVKDDDDSVQYCTFYSVNQVKKKKSGSWLIHHGHNKEKQQQHRFVYNVIGEMRLCNSSAEQKPENIASVIRESVLVDETEEGVKGRKEVAAVVIKKRKSAEENNGGTTVIIPGGVHSIPDKGAPTPLIKRWRTGGCCDCGGWDVGCKLNVLSNKTFLHDLFDQTFKLFHHEESDGKCGPVLAMTELKRGMYRVEFGSFLSHLQAFFVCVTVITCASEEEVTVSKTTGKSSSPFAPPLSPVGRA